MIAPQADARWRPRPLLALAVRALQYGVPLAAGTAATWSLAPVTAAVLSPLVGGLVALVVAVAVSLLVSRLTVRLAPLAVLLGMTMVFPDRAPSRLRVARRSTSVEEIRRQLLSECPDAQEAAVTLLSLVTALGRHDKHTRGHSERVRLFCDLLSRQLALSEDDAGRLRWAALVHDVGKLEVSASLLNKPGRLATSEWALVRMHPEAGARLAQPLAAWLGPWFAGIVEHHERFDGGGYPRGLVGSQISLAGRAVAVVDAFETMTSARCYRAAVSAAAARAELTRCAGTHFDPAMVRAFLSIALPRLLWSVGPLAFCINVPFLRWVGNGGARLAEVASTSVSGAANAAGVTAVVVATGVLPGTGAGAPARPPAPAAVRGADRASSGASGATRAQPANLRAGPAAAPTRTASPGASPTSSAAAAGGGSTRSRHGGGAADVAAARDAATAGPTPADPALSTGRTPASRRPTATSGTATTVPPDAGGEAPPRKDGGATGTGERSAR